MAGVEVALSTIICANMNYASAFFKKSIGVTLNYPFQTKRNPPDDSL